VYTFFLVTCFFRINSISLNSLSLIFLTFGFFGNEFLLIGIAVTRGVPARINPSKPGWFQIAGKLTSFGYLSVSTNPPKQVNGVPTWLIGGINNVDQPGAVLIIQ